MSGGLAVLCVAVGLFHLARLGVRRRDVMSELAHAAMGLGMAAMFAPVHDPVPGPVWTVVFVLSLAWFGAAALRSGTIGGDAGHHVVGSGAMLFMLAAGHAVHGDGTAGGLAAASLAALVLTGYFAWHALRCIDRCRSPEPEPEPGSGAVAAPGAATVALRARVRTFEAPQTAAVAHLVMAATMAVMLLGMV
jgi:Domain of unknown function (DUF5134)